MGERSHARSIRDTARSKQTGGTASSMGQHRLARIHRDKSRGQSLVEFALVLPIVLVLLLVALDFGRLFMSYVTLTNATRVAANFGATDPGAFTGTPNTATYDATVTRETAGMNCKLRPDVGGHNPPIPTYPGGSGLGGKSVASMTCDFTLLTPFVSNFFGGALAISAGSEFPIRTGALASVGGGGMVPPPGSPVAAFIFNNVSGGTIDGSGNVAGTGSVTVNVTNTSQNAQTLVWSWGDGSPDDYGSTPPAHTFSASGTNTVRLTVSNPVGSSSKIRTVTVAAAANPVAGFYGTPVANPPRYTAGGGSSGTPISGSLSLSVQFTNTSTGATAYSWNFGDGTGASTAFAPTHAYASLSVFTVTLTITAPGVATPQTRASYVTTGCVVPNFAGTLTNNAQASWTAAQQSGSIRYRTAGSAGNGNPNAPSGKDIVGQTVPGGSFVAATKQGQTWSCATNIILDYTP